MKVVVRRVSGAAGVRPRLFGRGKAFEEATEAHLQRELKAFWHLQEELVRGLKALDLHARVLEEREVAAEVYRLWNPCRPLGLGDYDPENIRPSLLFTDACVNDRGFALGDVFHRVVSLKILPDQTHASMARVLRTLPIDSKLFLSVCVPDQQKEFEFLQTQRRIAFSMARGKRAGVADLESEAKLDDLESLISQLVSQGEKVFQVSLNVLLRATNQEELDEQAARTLAAIREMSGAEGL